MKMKKTLLSIVTLLAITTSLFAQDSYDELLKKSRRARTTSTIFVVAGPVVAAGGIGTLLYGVIATAMEEPGSYYDPTTNNYIETPAKKHTTEMIVGGAGTLVGIALALTSIPFSNKADDFRREARKAKLKTSTDRITIPGLQNGYANSRTSQFKVSLMIPLGR
jgi:hypothetical protein